MPTNERSGISAKVLRGANTWPNSVESGDKLEQILSCGLRQQTLSTTGAKHLEILVSLAQTLELRDVTPSKLV